MAGIKFEQTSQDYSLEPKPERLTMISDASGRIVFPMRLRYASPARRFYGCLQQWRRFAYHASCGPHTWVFISYPKGYGENNGLEYQQSNLRYDGSGPTKVTRVLVLHKCRNGATGMSCLSWQSYSGFGAGVNVSFSP